MSNQKNTEKSQKLSKLFTLSKTDLIKYIDSVLEIEIYNDTYFEDMTYDELIQYVVMKKYKKITLLGEIRMQEIAEEDAEKKEKEKNKTTNEITMDEFDLDTVKDMSMMEARKAIDKHFIILNNGDHAMIDKGTVTMYDTKTLKSTYFNRLSVELQHYYFKDKTDIRKVICDIHKPFLTQKELNMSKKMKHTYKPYNTFSEETRKNVDAMIAYMKEVLCQGRDDILQHLLKIEARMVRGEKNDCCVYLKGPQGIGKSTHLEFLRFHVMGTGLSLESGSGPLKNKFNSELKGKVMTVFEELENFGPAEWLSISSTLKRWITSLTMQIEGKGKDVIEVGNIMTFWLLSNNDAIQDDDGRRYFIMPISTKYTDDYVYYGKLRDQCFNDEVGHAYYCYLMEIDLKGFNSQRYPVTSAKLDSYAKRLDVVYRFLKDTFILKRIGIKKVKVSDLYDLFILYCKANEVKNKHKQDFNKLLEDVNILRIKSNDKHIYDITYEELQKIADRKHWVHELDEYVEFEKKSKYFGNKIEQEVALQQGVDTTDQSVKQPTIQELLKQIENLQQQNEKLSNNKDINIEEEKEENEKPKKKSKESKSKLSTADALKNIGLC